jgi:putative hemolysin
MVSINYSPGLTKISEVSKALSSAIGSYAGLLLIVIINLTATNTGVALPGLGNEEVAAGRSITKGLQRPAMLMAATEDLLSLRNPAAEFCLGRGGTYVIRTISDESQTGICILSDGKEAGAWEYFREHANREQ